MNRFRKTLTRYRNKFSPVASIAVNTVTKFPSVRDLKAKTRRKKTVLLRLKSKKKSSKWVRQMNYKTRPNQVTCCLFRLSSPRILPCCERRHSTLILNVLWTVKTIKRISLSSRSVNTTRVKSTRAVTSQHSVAALKTCRGIRSVIWQLTASRLTRCSGHPQRKTTRIYLLIAQCSENR